jgi:hypothetical protein
MSEETDRPDKSTASTKGRGHGLGACPDTSPVRPP